MKRDPSWQKIRTGGLISTREHPHDAAAHRAAIETFGANDVMTAAAQALAVLVVATAKREGVPFEELLKEMLHSVAPFAIDMNARSQTSERRAPYVDFAIDVTRAMDSLDGCLARALPSMAQQITLTFRCTMAM